MKKRILALILVCVTMISLAACEKNKNDIVEPTADNTEITNPTTTPTENPDTEPEATTPEAQMRENGNFPSVDELTDAEKKYLQVELYDQVLQAAIDLDMETLRKYTKSQYLYGFEQIFANPEFKDMYKKTIGTYIYLPESEYIVAKDTTYVFAKWHTDLHINKMDIPKDITDITMEQANNIYENYYKDAPYNGFDFERNSFAVSIEDGYVYYNTDLMFNDILDVNLSSLYPTRGYGNPYVEFVFNDEADNLDTPYSTLKDEQALLETMYNFDIDKLHELFGNQEGMMTSLKRKVAKVYGDKEKLQKIKAWYLENCEVMVTTSSMHIFYIINDNMEIAEQQFPYTLFSDEELEKLKGLKLCDWMYVSTSDTGFAQLQSDIIDSARTAGIID